MLPMKLRHMIGLGATLAVVLTAAPATATEKPKPPKGTSKTLAAPAKLSPQELFRQQMQAYLAAVEARRLAIEEINRTFTTSVKSAQQAFKAARLAAMTAEAKTTAKEELEEAITVATVARQVALEKLDPLPPVPERPARKVSPTPTPTP